MSQLNKLLFHNRKLFFLCLKLSILQSFEQA